MKRLLIALTLMLLAAPPLFAQSDRAVLLTSDGTLYSVDTLKNDGTGSTLSNRYLVLTAVTSRGTTKTPVPATLTGGHNWQPALAYDDDSQTLFVLWLRATNLLATNELVFCSYQAGRWNATSTVENIPYHFRYNLCVGVTRTVELSDGEGTKQVPGLSVHVAWWSESGWAEGARYAMLTVEKGNVTDVYVRPLEEMIERTFLKVFPANANTRSFMRHPAVFESPNRDTIDVVFGDTATNTMHRITLKPVSNHRVRIPIGIRDASYPVPQMSLATEADAAINIVPSTPDRLVFYTTERGSLKYLIFEGGRWAPKVQSIALTDVSAGEAVAALRKMVNGD